MHRDAFTLDPGVVFLNHGSYGACPRVVQAAQAGWRTRMEHEPVRFFHHDLEGLVDVARRGLAAFLGADPDELAFVPNATTGVNAVLRSIELAAGDEILTTDHAYNACRNALDFVTARAGARVVVAAVPFPLESGEQIVSAVLAAAGPRTRLALLDHVTSPTALVFPLRRLVPALQARGIDVLVDGAHAPGMLPLDVRALGAAYYVGNCHKWLCAPKGAGFIVARRDRQRGLVPAVVSHGFNDPRDARSRFHLLFDWVGTVDPSAWLCVPEAIRVVGELGGGWAAHLARNHALAVEARRLLCDELGLAPPCPDDLLGAMVALPLGPGDAAGAAALHQALFERHHVEIPVFAWNGAHIVRASLQLYNELSEVARLAAALRELGCARLV